MPPLTFSQGQLENLSQRLDTDFVHRLDRVLQPLSPVYAGLPAARRMDSVRKVVDLAQEHGIREELNIGLFAALLLLFGASGLREGDTQEILADSERSGAAKVFQLWAWQRRRHPDAQIFRDGESAA
jgi:hypothetical protein